MITDGGQPWAPPTTTNTQRCKIPFFVTCPDHDEADEPCKAGEDDCATDDIDDENEDEDGPWKVDEGDCAAAADDDEENEENEEKAPENPNPQTIH